MASLLDRVCMVIDMDGFYLRRFHRFVPREVGVAFLTHGGTRHVSLRTKLYHLDPPTGIDKLTVDFCEKKIGLGFNPSLREVLEDGSAPPFHRLWRPEEIPQVLQHLYQQARTCRQDVVAYKGGNHEQDMLKRLKIPSVDLEKTFGCPKYQTLVRWGPPEKEISVGCTHHYADECARWEKPEVLHCAYIKVYVYRQWILDTAYWRRHPVKDRFVCPSPCQPYKHE